LATVITNLLSAIPVFGKDLVELIWGGFKTVEPYNSDIVLQILLIAEKSSIALLQNKIRYNHMTCGVHDSLLNPSILGGRRSHYSYMVVKRLINRRKSAGIRKKSSFEVPQRLDAGDLRYAMLVGLIEGDGWFLISKKGKYLMYEFGIELSIRDVQLIYKIKEMLGVGTVFFRNKEKWSNTVILRVINKSDLCSIVLPIFDKYPLLSNKQYDYLRFKHTILKGFKYSEELDKYTRPIFPLNSSEYIENVEYFSAWLVGFIEAEGCFSVYTPSTSSTKVASFDIAQTKGENLILAISKYLSFTQKIHLDKTNCFKIKVTSARSIENIVKFLDRAPIKLQGYKKLQYLLWLKELRQITRYTNKFKIPEIY
jgi:LAGLIDADG endonuclease